jgi:hypothetical protein
MGRTAQRAKPDPLDLVNVGLLPPNLRVLCRALGNRKAFALCKARGGVPLQVPTRASLTHWLVEVIGFDGLQALVEALGGEAVDVPKYDKVAMQLQHREVHACLKAGMGLTRTALKTGYTKRHVLNLQTELAHAEGERYDHPDGLAQRDLFAEALVAQPLVEDDADFEAMEEAAVAEQERAVSGVDQAHREVALAAQCGAHDPFGISKRS